MIAYFYCHTSSFPDISYHTYISIAEGLITLDIPCFGNRNMYQSSVGSEYLIKNDKTVRMEDADIVFFHSNLFDYVNENTNNTIRKITQTAGRKFITVFIDDADGLITPGYEKGAQSCDMVLKCHYNEKYKYPSNFHPWQFGLTNRILNAVKPQPFEKRDNSILVNFRAKHQLRDFVNSKIRTIVEKNMFWDQTTNGFTTEGYDSEDLMFWKQTGGRHCPDYYNKLSHVKVCSCYGGVFAVSWGNTNKYTAKIVRKLNDFIKLSKWDRVRQWDSWRLWEAWAAGCCVIHIDFDKYGCRLPEMPENGIHYIGIDIDDLDKFERIFNHDARSIAQNGKEFILKNYTPFHTAKRLLKMIQQ